jgi:hypothetical protein
LGQRMFLRSQHLDRAKHAAIARETDGKTLNERAQASTP